MASAKIAFAEETTVDASGIEWIGVRVLSTDPIGAIVKWVGATGAVIAECSDGDYIEIVVGTDLEDSVISITPAIEE